MKGIGKSMPCRGLLLGLAGILIASGLFSAPRPLEAAKIQPTPAPTKKPDSGSTGSSTANVSGLTNASTKPADSEKLIERVVTGIGTDPDKALQSAFSQAIESAVGVLVDAETVVKNDQIIKDQILTFSRGFVQKYDVVKQWQADGLHHATINALVQTGKLSDKLKANNIATHEVPGELISRQIRFDFKNEAEAAEMLKKVLDGLDMTKLTKVELVGKEIKREGASAKMVVSAKVSPDMAKWQEMSKDLRLILDKTATKRAAGDFTIQGGTMLAQLKGDGVLIGLFVSADLSGDHLQWEVFRVPQPLEAAVEETAKRLAYRVVFTLLDGQGREVVRTTENITIDIYGVLRPIGKADVRGRIRRRGVTGDAAIQWLQADVWRIGPVWMTGKGWEGGYGDRPSGCNSHPYYSAASEMVLSPEDMAKVTDVKVTLEAVDVKAKGR